MSLDRVVCECTYDLTTPWDRFCAGCGRSLTGDGKLIVVPVGQKVDDREKVAFRIANNSPVAVNVKIPHVAADSARMPPQWLAYDVASGGAQEFELVPGASRVISFGIRRSVIEEMLREPGGRGPGSAGVGAVAYDLRVFTDADYRKQDHTVTLSLLGQADLRPEAIEFPSVWLTNPGTLRLPLRLFNASGEEMFIEHVKTWVHGDDTNVKEVVDALFPESAFADYRNRPLPPGEFVDVALETRPIVEVLEKLTRDKGPRFVDPHHKRRNSHWIERWPELMRIRFVVEATMHTRGPDTVPPVRSLIVLTLVRPPLVRDRTPDDQLWQRVGGTGSSVNGVFRVQDGEVCDLVADLVNDSAMPVVLKRVVTNRPWLTVMSAHEDSVLAPGAAFNLRVQVDLAKRGAAELREAHVSAQLHLETWPPTPVPRIDDVHIEAPSTIVLQGCLGVDFGTSNCAVSFMPDGDLPDEHSGVSSEPVSLPLEQVLDDVFDTMPSVMWRRRVDDPHANDVEFMFGRDAEASEVQRPANAVRGIKRILTRNAAFEFKLVTDDANNPIKTYSARDLAARMLLHMVQQIRARSVTWHPLRQRLRLTTDGLGGNAAEELTQATSFRFAKAVFTHPVDASDELKRALYDCALAAGLASEQIDGERQLLDYDTFVKTRLIDESSAAISTFVFSYQAQLARATNRILCLDVGGGTTDISAIDFRPVVRFKEGDKFVTRPTLDLLFRRGVNDFAGMDIDRAIVMRCIVTRMNDKLRGPTQGAQIDEVLLESALRGDSANVLAQSVRHLVDPVHVAAAVDLLGEAARVLVREAEQIKILAGVDPTGSYPMRLSSSAIPPLLHEGTLRTDLESRLDLHIDVPFAEVNDLIRELVRARLPVLDEAVRKARWGWGGVDLLMFTGQTCRALALQEVVLHHVQQARGGSLPTLVVPSTSLPGGITADVISFDPKMCVPSGAALRGYKAAGKRIDRLQLRVRPQVTTTVHAGRDLVRRGDPLPAFCAATVHTDDDRFVVVDIGDHQSVVTVPVEVPNGLLTIVVDETEACWLLHTAATGPAAADVPSSIADAVSRLPLEFQAAAGVAGPVVTWLHRIDAVVGSAR